MQPPRLLSSRGELVQPSRFVKDITNWDQVSQGQRGQTYKWIPSGSSELVVNLTGQTAAITQRLDKFQSPIPRNAKDSILIVSIASNTNAGGVVNWLGFPDVNAGTGVSNACAAISATMNNASNINRGQHRLPIVNGGLYYQAAVTGTVNYDLLIYLVGFVLE